jgi:hypothetical protein
MMRAAQGEFQRTFAQNSAKVAARSSGTALPQHLAKQFGRIDAQGLCNGDELRDVDLSLIALDHANDRVGSLETRRKLPLRQFFAFTRFGEGRSDGLRRGTSKCLQIWCAPIY